MEVSAPFCCRKPCDNSGAVKIDSYNVSPIIDSFRCRSSRSRKINRGQDASLVCYITMLNAQRILELTHLLTDIIDIEDFCAWYARKINIGIDERRKRGSRNHRTHRVQECG